MAVILCWLLFLVIESLKKGNLFSSGPTLYYQYLPGHLIWILITFPLLKVFSRTTGLPLFKRGVILMLVGIAAGVFKNVSSWFVMYVAGVISERYSATLDSLGNFYSQVPLFYYMEAIIIAWVLLIIFYMLELYRNFRQKSIEAAQLESQLAKAQLETLRAQLQPHFLFNAHNTVAMLIRTEKYNQATEMISKISDLLRNSLKTQDKQVVPLEREMQLIEAYLEIEQVRFEDHLDISFDLGPDTMTGLVPNLLLQSIIENAFKHGISKSLGRNELSILTQRIENTLQISVYNSGPPLPEGWNFKRQSGIGLSNAVERLSRLYGKDSYKFNIFNKKDGVQITLEIPFKTSISDGH